MDFFKKNLGETFEVINDCIAKNDRLISTKKIRTYHNIRSSNHSKINFIWRSLEYLRECKILELNGSSSPKKYKIKIENQIDINTFLEEVS